MPGPTAPDWTLPDPNQPGRLPVFGFVPELGHVLRVSVEPAPDAGWEVVTIFPRPARREEQVAMNILRHTFDPDADAAYCHVGPGPIVDTEEVADGILVDWSQDGSPVGVEVLHVVQRLAGGDLESFLKGLVEELFARKLEAAE